MNFSWDEFKKILAEKLPHSHNGNFNYNQISEYVFAGSNQCCRMGLHDLLVKEGIQIDVSVEEEEIDAPHGVSSYHWIPVKDHGVPTRDQIEIFYSILSSAEKRSQKVFVHCKNGHGRTGIMLALYYMIKFSFEYTKALQMVKEKRQSVHFSREQLKFIEEYKV